MLSVRSYLIEHKGFTERQYRYILSKSKLNQWHIRREEIQNQVVSAKATNIVDKIVRSHELAIRTSNLNLLQINRKLTRFNPSTGRSIDLLNCAKALSISQDSGMAAYGLSVEGLRLILENQDQLKVSPSSHPQVSETEKLNKAVARLEYDDVVDIIKAQRRKRRELAALKQKTEDMP